MTQRKRKLPYTTAQAPSPYGEGWGEEEMPIENGIDIRVGQGAKKSFCKRF